VARRRAEHQERYRQLREQEAASIFRLFFGNGPRPTREQIEQRLDSEIQMALTEMVALLPTLPKECRRPMVMLQHGRRQPIGLAPCRGMNALLVLLNRAQHGRMLFHARKDGHDKAQTWLESIYALRGGTSGNVVSKALQILTVLKDAPDADTSASAEAWRKAIHRRAA
jgi:hypothetical protein